MTTVLQFQHEIDGVQVSCKIHEQRGGGKGPGPPIGSGKGSYDQSTVTAVQEQVAAALTTLLSQQPQQQTKPEVAPATVSCKLFVGGLQQSTTPTNLQEVFEAYGPCECEIVMDKVTGRSRCFGFVRYSSPAGAEMA